jgi:tetratricopeptide (TPR) repeat protein
MKSAALTLGAMLLSTTGIAAGTAPTKEVATLLADGDTAAAAFNLQGTLEAYRKAYELAPDNYEAAWKLVRALTDKATLTTNRTEQEQLCQEAIPIARKAVELEPDDPMGHDYLAIALGKLALFEGGKRKVELSKEVEAQADEALKLDPKNDIALHVLGVWNREMATLGWFQRTFARMLYGKLPEASLAAAAADLKRATELRPEVVAHHVELGITLAESRDWADAKVQLDKGLSLPTDWVTDSYYRVLARKELPKVEAHLR